MGWQLIESQSLSASAASVTFSNIPQTYKSLMLTTSVRSTQAATAVQLIMRPNGSSANGTNRYLEGTGSAAASGTNTTVYMGAIPGSSATSSTFSNDTSVLPNYTSTTANKPVSIDSVSENNATASWQSLNASLWSSTSAITSIQLVLSAGDFVFGSTFTLYGLA